jgi:uncharacterized membrane protein
LYKDQLMKKLATILLDLIPLALTVIFVIAIVLTLSHVVHDPVAAMSEETPKTDVACPSAKTAKAAKSENVNEAARSGELDNYITSQFP